MLYSAMVITMSNKIHVTEDVIKELATTITFLNLFKQIN